MAGIVLTSRLSPELAIDDIEIETPDGYAFLSEWLTAVQSALRAERLTSMIELLCRGHLTKTRVNKSHQEEGGWATTEASIVATKFAHFLCGFLCEAKGSCKGKAKGSCKGKLRKA